MSDLLQKMHAAATERPTRAGAEIHTGAFYLLLVLLFCIPGYLLLADTSYGTSTDDATPATWVMQGLVTAWSALRIIIVLWKGSPRLLTLTFYIYTYVFLGLAPLAQLRTGLTPGDGVIARGEQITVAIIILIGIGAYELGQFWEMRKGGSGRDSQRQNGSHFDIRRVWILGGMGTVFSCFNIATVGLASFFAYRADSQATAVDAYGGTQVASIIAVLATIPLLVSILGLIAERRRRQERVYGTALLFMILVLLIQVNPISSSRFWLGVVGGSLIIFMLRQIGTAARFRILGTTLLALLVIAFPYADRFRNAASSQAATPTPSLAAQLSEKLDYDSYAQVALATRYVTELGYTSGSQLVGALVAPLPRAWWASKPQDTGIILAQFAHYKFTSVSAPLWAEAWIDGSYAWLIIVFFALGCITRRFEQRLLWDATLGTSVLSAAVPTMALYQIITLRGSFLQQTPRLVIFLLAFWFVSQRTLERRGQLNEPRAE